MTTPEGKVKERVKRVLKEYAPHVTYFMPAMGTFGKSGVSDFVVCAGGRFLAIETKHDAKKNKPTPLQLKFLDEVSAAGGIGVVVDANNVDELKGLLDALVRS